MKKSKLILTALLMSIFIVSCNGSKIKKSIEPNAELYELTDGFVESLKTTYESYGTLHFEDNIKRTKDGLYRVLPVGRLINVKTESYSSSREYEILRDDLRFYYKNNIYVNDVDICGGGTIMIDCRN